MVEGFGRLAVRQSHGGDMHRIVFLPMLKHELRCGFTEMLLPMEQRIDGSSASVVYADSGNCQIG